MEQTLCSCSEPKWNRCSTVIPSFCCCFIPMFCCCNFMCHQHACESIALAFQRQYMRLLQQNEWHNTRAEGNAAAAIVIMPTACLSVLLYRVLYGCLLPTACKQGNCGAVDHNEDDVFAVLPLPPRMRKQRGLPPKGPSSPRPSLQGRIGLSDHSRRSVSFKHGNCDNKIGILASGIVTSQDWLGARAKC